MEFWRATTRLLRKGKLLAEPPPDLIGAASSRDPAILALVEAPASPQPRASDPSAAFSGSYFDRLPDPGRSGSLQASSGNLCPCYKGFGFRRRGRAASQIALAFIDDRFVRALGRLTQAPIVRARRLISASIL